CPGKHRCCSQSALEKRSAGETPLPDREIVHGRPASTRVTSYPAWAGRGRDTGPPPGQRVIRPPTINTAPPNQTHQTRGLMLNRYTACSVPSTDPAKTIYRSSCRLLRIPTSVDGSKVGRLKLSTCWRFSLVMLPAGRPSLDT